MLCTSEQYSIQFTWFPDLVRHFTEVWNFFYIKQHHDKPVSKLWTLTADEYLPTLHISSHCNSYILVFLFYVTSYWHQRTSQHFFTTWNIKEKRNLEMSWTESSCVSNVWCFIFTAECRQRISSLSAKVKTHCHWQTTQEEIFNKATLWFMHTSTLRGKLNIHNELFRGGDLRWWCMTT